jgi:hypothetical protein
MSMPHVNLCVWGGGKKCLFKSRTGSDVTYSCYHNSTRSYFALICAFVAFLCLSFVTINHITYILTEGTNTFA